MTVKGKSIPFIGAVPARSPAGFGAAIFGAPHGTPYKGIPNCVHAAAPECLSRRPRGRCRLARALGLPCRVEGFLETGVALAELGNLATKPGEVEKNRKLIEACTRLESGKRVLSRLCSAATIWTPTPFIAGFARSPPIFPSFTSPTTSSGRDTIQGERYGYSSTMPESLGAIPRLAHRPGWHARPGYRPRNRKLGDAAAWGSHIVTARDPHRSGIEAVL